MNYDYLGMVALALHLVVAAAVCAVGLLLSVLLFPRFRL
jgi:hypothetical protein